MTEKEQLIADVEVAKTKMQQAAAAHGMDSAEFNAAYADQLAALEKLGDLTRRKL